MEVLLSDARPHIARTFLTQMYEMEEDEIRVSDFCQLERFTDVDMFDV